jgi:hypothetical protein
MAVRVEVFRHGDEIFYGRLTTLVPPWYVRACNRFTWTPGEVIIKGKFGVLKFNRDNGEAEDVYNLFATVLCKYDEEHNYDLRNHCKGHDSKNFTLEGRFAPVAFGIESYDGETLLPQPVNIPQDDGDEALEACVDFEPKEGDFRHSRKYLAWQASVQKGQEKMRDRRCLFAGDNEEHLVFLWSFKESGLLLDPYDYFNDVVVTTDRLRLASEAYYKTFDCRTYLCWGAFYCAWVNRICGRDTRPKMRSFLNFSQLDAFSTETSEAPPFFPVECPCYNSFCSLLTSCVCCDLTGCMDATKECCVPPRIAPPVSQIWFKWLQRYAKAVQPDMVLSLRPYPLRVSSPGRTPIHLEIPDDLEHGGRSLAEEATRIPMSRDSNEVMMLRQLMQWILVAEDEARGKFPSRR